MLPSRVVSVSSMDCNIFFNLVERPTLAPPQQRPHSCTTVRLYTSTSSTLVDLLATTVPSRQNTGKRTNSRQSGGGGAEIGSSVMLGRPAAAAAAGLRAALPTRPSAACSARGEGGRLPAPA
jgi:hypothetical protein